MLGRGLAIATVLLATRASADESIRAGADPETASVASSNVAHGQSIGVALTNPALLVDVDERVHVALLLNSPRGSIRLKDRRRGTDVSRSIFDSTVATATGGEDRALPTVELANRRSDTTLMANDSRFAVGLVSKLGIDRLRLAVLAVVPTGASDAANIRTHYDDEREGAFSNRLHFLRFGEGPRIASVIASAGVKVTPWLSLGVGVRLAAAATARLQVYVPDAAVQSEAQTNLETSVATSWRPLVGVRAEPFSWLSLALAFRAESAFRVEGASEVSLWNDHVVGADRTIPRRTVMSFPLVFGFEPAEIALGVATKASRITFGAAATMQLWSRYVDHHGVKPEDSARFIGSTFDANEYKFRDVVVLSGGGTFAATRALSFSAGLSFHPSPVPAQTGRTSFVDNSLICVSAGERAAFSILGRRFSVAISFQLFHMLPRETHKDPMRTIDAFPDDARTLQSGDTMPESRGLQTNSPGFPGYQASGWLLTSSVSLAHHF